MAIDFSAFDEKIDLKALQKEVEEAPDTDFADVGSTYLISRFAGILYEDY